MMGGLIIIGIFLLSAITATVVISGLDRLIDILAKYDSAAFNPPTCKKVGDTRRNGYPKYKSVIDTHQSNNRPYLLNIQRLVIFFFKYGIGKLKIIAPKIGGKYQQCEPKYKTSHFKNCSHGDKLSQEGRGVNQKQGEPNYSIPPGVIIET